MAISKAQREELGNLWDQTMRGAGIVLVGSFIVSAGQCAYQKATAPTHDQIVQKLDQFVEQWEAEKGKAAPAPAPASE